ncbi:MAG: hypothetical protein RI885_235 [Actinomycetota bacterium]
MPGTTALVRRPSSRLQQGELTHLDRARLDRIGVDIDLAGRQWDAYVSALADHGFGIVEVDVAEEFPDSVFVEDTAVVFGRTAVIANPGAVSRRGETAGTRATIEALGLEVRELADGHLDGGDVLKVGATVYVGRGGRTDAAGIRSLRRLVTPLGYEVVAVPVARVLHLKSAVTALPDGTVIGHAPLVEYPQLFPRFLAVPEESGAAVVVLDETSVLMASSAPLTAELIENLGYSVVTVDVGEFEKLEGCVTCLSVRVR